MRQRIANIAGGEQEQVITSAAPKADDLMPSDTNATDGATNEAEASEWTRLRILDDCEVNGVRFPKTVIIDVKSEDAEKLISSGKAELAVEDTAPSTSEAGPSNDQTADAETTDTQAGLTEPMITTLLLMRLRQLIRQTLMKMIRTVMMILVLCPLHSKTSQQQRLRPKNLKNLRRKLQVLNRSLPVKQFLRHQAQPK